MNRRAFIAFVAGIPLFGKLVPSAWTPAIVHASHNVGYASQMAQFNRILSGAELSWLRQRGDSLDWETLDAKFGRSLVSWWKLDEVTGVRAGVISRSDEPTSDPQYVGGNSSKTTIFPDGS